MNDVGFENLRAGILRQAVTDYMKALKDGKNEEASKLEWFFKSEWGEMLSGGYGDFIISECKKRANINDCDG